MTDQERWQLQGSASRLYEEQKVPALFRPLAELTLRHVDIRDRTGTRRHRPTPWSDASDALSPVARRRIG